MSRAKRFTSLFQVLAQNRVTDVVNHALGTTLRSGIYANDQYNYTSNRIATIRILTGMEI